MSKNSAPAPRALLLIVFFVAFGPISFAVGAKETVLYTFFGDGSTGDRPVGSLVRDKHGNLFGTTMFGGTFNVSCGTGGCGTVFELSPPADARGAWTEIVIYEFQGSIDGGRPTCTPVIDEDGNLYGTSIYYVSSSDYGAVVWELSPPANPGGAWTEKTLYTFPNFGFSGFESGSLLADRAGNFYGTSTGGGVGCEPVGCGVIFEVSPPRQPLDNWVGSILYSFQCGLDSSNPSGSLVLDDNGILYGTTAGNDYPCGYGTVFRLVPPLQPGSPWTENVLYSFSGVDGENPYGGVVVDRAGNLYGTTAYGGPLRCNHGEFGCGNVFELSPPSQPGGTWTETVLYNFYGPKTEDGQHPFTKLIINQSGNLYGTTTQGGVGNGGTVFELVSPHLQGGHWIKRQFALEGDGSNPLSGLMFGPGMAVSGTGTGGLNGGGVFSITP